MTNAKKLEEALNFYSMAAANCPHVKLIHETARAHIEALKQEPKAWQLECTITGQIQVTTDKAWSEIKRKQMFEGKHVCKVSNLYLSPQHQEKPVIKIPRHYSDLSKSIIEDLIEANGDNFIFQQEE